MGNIYRRRRRNIAFIKLLFSLFYEYEYESKYVFFNNNNNNIYT